MLCRLVRPTHPSEQASATFKKQLKKNILNIHCYQNKILMI